VSSKMTDEYDRPAALTDKRRITGSVAYLSQSLISLTLGLDKKNGSAYGYLSITHKESPLRHLYTSPRM
jgi:hypothetical protein